MSNVQKRLVPSVLLLLAAAAFTYAQKATGEKWELQYSFEERDSFLTITDLKFSSSQRGIVSGFVDKRVANLLIGDHEKEIPVVLVTGNGGRTWAQIQVKELPLSLFLLNDGLGWMVSSDGLWMTTEGGRAWKKVSSIKNLLHVQFLSATRGFASGSGDRILETIDGGVTWAPIVKENQPKLLRTVGTEFGVIAFANANEALIGGSVIVPPRFDYPGRKRLNSFVTTKNGGRSWHEANSMMMGQLIGASFDTSGRGLALLQYPQPYGWPSEVFYMAVGTDEDNRLIYRDRHRAITDVLLGNDGLAFLAGYELPGKSHESPIPGKVRILQSRNFEDWTELPVDYRAVAHRVILGSAQSGEVWAATDTGSILKLNKNAKP